MKDDPEKRLVNEYLRYTASRRPRVGRPEEHFTPKPNRNQWYRQQSKVILDDDLPFRMAACGVNTTARSHYHVDKRSWDPPKVIKRASVSKTLSTVPMYDSDTKGTSLLQAHSRDVHRRLSKRYEKITYPDVGITQIQLGNEAVSYRTTTCDHQEPPVTKFTYGSPPKRFTGRNNISNFSLNYSEPARVGGMPRAGNRGGSGRATPPPSIPGLPSMRRPSTAAAALSGFRPNVSLDLATLSPAELENQASDIYKTQTTRMNFKSKGPVAAWWGDASTHL